MSEGKIKNFTLAGDMLTMSAMVNSYGETRYSLEMSYEPHDTLTHDEMVHMLEEMVNDIDGVFQLGMTYKYDENGKLKEDANGNIIQDKMSMKNSIISTFERTWSND